MLQWRPIQTGTYLASGHVSLLHYPPLQAQTPWAAEASILEKMERGSRTETITLCTQSYEPLRPTTDWYTSMATFSWVRRMLKSHLHWLVAKPMPMPFILYWDPIHSEENRMKKEEHQWNIQTASVSSIPPPLHPIHVLPWPIRMHSVKLVNQISGIYLVLRWFLAHAYVVVTSPLDEVTQLPIVPSRVEYVVDFSFLFFLDYHWVGFRRWLTSDWWCITIEMRRLENIVLSHYTWQV